MKERERYIKGSKSTIIYCTLLISSHHFTMGVIPQRPDDEFGGVERKRDKRSVIFLDDNIAGHTGAAPHRDR
jgi:hypothetical protein